MKTRYAIAVFVAVGAAVAAPALAQEDPIATLAKQSGLSERKVRMLVGARTAFAEYRSTFDRSEDKLIKAIGRSNYERLLSGQPIELPRQAADERAVAAASNHD